MYFYEYIYIKDTSIDFPCVSNTMTQKCQESKVCDCPQEETISLSSIADVACCVCMHRVYRQNDMLVKGNTFCKHAHDIVTENTTEHEIFELAISCLTETYVHEEH